MVYFDVRTFGRFLRFSQRFISTLFLLVIFDLVPNGIFRRQDFLQIRHQDVLQIRPQDFWQISTLGLLVYFDVRPFCRFDVRTFCIFDVIPVSPIYVMRYDTHKHTHTHIETDKLKQKHIATTISWRWKKQDNNILGNMIKVHDLAYVYLNSTHLHSNRKSDLVVVYQPLEISIKQSTLKQMTC